nr:signal peptidase I [Enterococcus sp. 10A9_DIV0425]
MIKKITLVSSLVLIFILAFILCIILLPRVFGLTTHIVDDYAMSPHYLKGSLIYVQKKQPETILVGDVITYYENSGKQIVTRRVVAVGDQHEAFYTKGDAEKQIEPGAVKSRNIIGTPIFQLPYIGILLSKNAFSWIRRIFFAVAFCLSGITAWHTILELKKRRENTLNFLSRSNRR